MNRSTEEKINKLWASTNHSSDGAKGYFLEHHRVLGMLPYARIEELARRLLQAYADERTIFLFGNGGSAALASHFACDLGKGTLVRSDSSKRFRVVSLTDNVPLITAWANDVSYEDIFAEQLRNLAVSGDIAFAISGSGNSGNVLRALEAAKSLGCGTMGITGFSGGRMKSLCEYCIVIPSDNMQVIEDFHLSVCHALFANICRHMHEPAERKSATTSAAHAD